MMTIGQRDEQAADVGPLNVSTGSTARTTAQQTETFTSDPYAVRREGTLRVQNGIYLLFGILEGLLAIRFVLPLLGANPAAGFAQFIYGVTKPFLAPFVGLFGTTRFGNSVFEVNPLVAILVYALIAWVLVKAIGLVIGDTRRGVRTTSSQIDTRVR
ncbi:YggT family protein [Candidatus Amarolinea aalborgensis]|uniref:YggT family protein n=1 Tax=Candidatus Amarolinea aalborgensis TaxID=2249329 RepID=UPI003BF996FE